MASKAMGSGAFLLMPGLSRLRTGTVFLIRTKSRGAENMRLETEATAVIFPDGILAIQ